ncbi:HipA domain-containing protein [Aneurinibacillus migulanus]|uniref:HipA domain-containing protein n=1 Tax=Aneurinibacillus migulanus TaxID=47500 RepID=UPI0020A1A23B|nr:HipA domain-containing protein [Aneurinibacillus migulanus]
MTYIDLSTWQRIKGFQAPGARTKFWFLRPNSKQRYLFKMPHKDTGEAWAEQIAANLLRLLDFPTFQCEFAQFEGRIGVLLESFREDDEEFFEGVDLLNHHVEGFDTHSLYGYEFDIIIEVLQPLQLDSEFARIMVFDAFIGNQDRHCQNWGILGSNGTYRMAPPYDNGSSLGQLLTEQKINQMMRDTMMFKGFINRGYSIVGLAGKKKPKYHLILEHVKQQYPKEIEETINRLDALEETSIIRIIDAIPDEVMSSLHKEFVNKLIQYRKNWLLEWHRKE